jgi:hypothetical protein
MAQIDAYTVVSRCALQEVQVADSVCLDRTQGESRFVPAGKLVLTCSQPECRHRADYSRAKVSRFQKS